MRVIETDMELCFTSYISSWEYRSYDFKKSRPFQMEQGNLMANYLLQSVESLGM